MLFFYYYLYLQYFFIENISIDKYFNIFINLLFKKIKNFYFLFIINN